MGDYKLLYATLSRCDVKNNRIMHCARDQRRWQNANKFSSRSLLYFGLQSRMISVRAHTNIWFR